MAGQTSLTKAGKTTPAGPRKLNDTLESSAVLVLFI
jgi:hypothetical protein